MKEISEYSPSKDPRLIKCKTECGNERCFAKRYGLFAEKTCPNFKEPKPITNADRIRAMSVEEMAEFMKSSGAGCLDGHFVGDYDCKDCKNCWLDWLKQEVTNDPGNMDARPSHG